MDGRKRKKALTTFIDSLDPITYPSGILNDAYVLVLHTNVEVDDSLVIGEH